MRSNEYTLCKFTLPNIKFGGLLMVRFSVSVVNEVFNYLALIISILYNSSINSRISLTLKLSVG